MEALRMIVNANKDLSDVYGRVVDRARTIWQRLGPEELLSWLHNFDGEEEWRLALTLADGMLYYSEPQIRQLWRKILLNKVKLHMIDTLYTGQPVPRDQTWFGQYLMDRAVFVGYGRAGKSGPAMAYGFKHGHGIAGLRYMELFELLNTRDALESKDWVFFLDDFVGSGHQAVQTWLRRAGLRSPAELRNQYPNVHFGYLVLLSTTAGRNEVETSTQMKVFFGEELDDRFKCFSDNSIIYADPADRVRARNVMYSKGLLLWPACPLGYDGMELAVAFSHNTPDDSLPVIWKRMSDGSWNPLFERQE
jgi:hypothetical protein